MNLFMIMASTPERRFSFTKKAVSLSLILFVLLTAITSSLSSALFDCETEGCSWTGPPVCGDNGITYANECLAVCQNAILISVGPCSKSTIASDSISFDDGTNVTVTMMQRFQQEQFVLTGRRNIHELVSPANDDGDSSAKEQTTTSQELFFRWSRFTADGYEYTAIFTTNDDFEQETPQTRSLAVLGPDTRQVVTNNSSYPYSTICELDYGFGRSEGGCTGTLIDKNSILTAAHCLYNYARNEWTAPLRMAPGRYRATDGTTVEPHGLYAWLYSTVFSVYRTTGDAVFDVGVATYNSNSQGVFPGDVAGSLCLAPATAQKLEEQTIIVPGYAADVPDGALVEAVNCFMKLSTMNQIEHDCDTGTAQSGAPLIRTTRTTSELMGMHIGFKVSSQNIPTTNIAIAWNNETYSSVFAWAPDATSCMEEADTTLKSFCDGFY